LNAKHNSSTIVDRAIQKAGGSPTSFAKQLSKIAGEEITRQRVHGWRLRGIFPRHIIPHVEALCGIPIMELIQAKPKDRDEGNMVNRAIRFLGADATPALLAERLTELSGRKITRQMVNGYQVLEQFPLELVPFVHMLTRIPVKELVEGRAPKTKRTRNTKREGRLTQTR
jgi:hypothetical protein